MGRRRRVAVTVTRAKSWRVAVPRKLLGLTGESLHLRLQMVRPPDRSEGPDLALHQRRHRPEPALQLPLHLETVRPVNFLPVAGSFQRSVSTGRPGAWHLIKCPTRPDRAARRTRTYRSRSPRPTRNGSRLRRSLDPMGLPATIEHAIIESYAYPHHDQPHHYGDRISETGMTPLRT